MKVLLICDDHYHPGQVVVDGLAPLKEFGYDFDVITDADEFKTDMLKNYPVVIMSKSDAVSAQNNKPWKTTLVQHAFVSYVENGGGLLTVHCGTVAGKDTAMLDKLIGCKFSFHPVDCPVLVQSLKQHPVTEGVESFCEIDEHYRLDILAGDVDIIVASYSPEQGDPEKYESEPYFNTKAYISPAALVRKQGKGRVCTLTPGHLLPVWHNPNYQRMLKNALEWCAGKE
jgi:type 1 glutamine amidotransferase